MNKTDLDIETEKGLTKMHSQLAAEAAKKATEGVARVKLDTDAKVARLERNVNTLMQHVQSLENRYNLLLTERFSSGPTVKDD